MFRRQGGKPRGRLFAMEFDLVILNSAYHFQYPARGIGAVLGLETHPEHSVQHQSQKADHGMSADAIGQTMEHGIDFDLALQDPESPLNIGQRFVSADDFFRSVVRHVGDQKQFPVEHSGSVESLLIQVVLEVLGVERDFEDMPQMSIRHRLVETGVTPASESFLPR